MGLLILHFLKYDNMLNLRNSRKHFTYINGIINLFVVNMLKDKTESLEEFKFIEKAVL